MRQLLFILSVLFLLFTSCSHDDDNFGYSPTSENNQINQRWAIAEIYNFSQLWELVDGSPRDETTYNNQGQAIGWRYLLERVIVNGQDELVSELAYDATSGVRLEIRTYDDAGKLERIILIGENFPYQSKKESFETLTLVVDYAPGKTAYWENAPIHTHWCLTNYDEGSSNCEDAIGDVSSIKLQL